VFLCAAGLCAALLVSACASKSEPSVAGSSQQANDSADMPTPATTNTGTVPNYPPIPSTPSQPAPPPDVSNMATAEYTVSPGDSLWKIARDHNTSVATIKALNSMASDVVRVGQVIKVPARQ